MKLVRVLGVIIITLFVLNVIYANKLVGFGQVALDVQEEVASLEKANRELLLKIAKEKSLSTVTQKIDGSDYTTTLNTVALTEQGHVALK